MQADEATTSSELVIELRKQMAWLVGTKPAPTHRAISFVPWP
jgi:hypothetical protein